MSRPTAAPSRRTPPRPPSSPSGPTTAALLAAVVALLSIVGLVMVLSASSVQALEETGSTWTYFVRHAVYVVAGTAALLVGVRVDYRRWRRFVVPLVGVSWLLLIAVLIPGVGIDVNGAGRWVGVGSLRFQPAELVKLAMLLFAADLLARRHDRMADSRLTLRPVLAVLGVTSVLMMLQPDLGSTIVVGTIVMAVLFVAGVPMLRLTGVVAAGSGVAIFLALRAPYRRRRILAFLDPSADPGNVAYHINQSLMGVASGGLLGVGLGASRAKYGFLPNAHTDFIFAIIAEELGLVGGLAIVACFVGFALLGTKAAIAAPDRFGTLVAAGITAWIVVQAFVNIGGVIGILPITGVTLPFISFGGSSLVLIMGASGILLNIARQGRAAAVRAERSTGRAATTR